MRYITVKEYASIFRKPDKTIYRWIKEGFIEVKKVSDGYLIPYSEVERVLEEGKHGDG